MSEAAAAPLEGISYLEKLGLLLAGQPLEASARRSAVLAFVLPQEILPAPHAPHAPDAPERKHTNTFSHVIERLVSHKLGGGVPGWHRHGAQAWYACTGTSTFYRIR